jgi:hypothetical protein
LYFFIEAHAVSSAASLSAPSNVCRLLDLAAIAIKHIDRLPWQAVWLAAGVMQLGNPRLPAVFAPKQIWPPLERSKAFNDFYLVTAFDEAKIGHIFPNHSLWVTPLCVAALFGALTVLGLITVFLALCVVMRAIAYTLSSDFAKVLKLPR